MELSGAEALAPCFCTSTSSPRPRAEPSSLHPRAAVPEPDRPHLAKGPLGSRTSPAPTCPPSTVGSGSSSGGSVNSRHPSIPAGYHFLSSDTKQNAPHLAASNPNHITNKEESTEVFKTSGCCATTAIKSTLTFSHSAWRETDCTAGQRRTCRGNLSFLIAWLHVATSETILSGRPCPGSPVHSLRGGLPLLEDKPCQKQLCAHEGLLFWWSSSGEGECQQVHALREVLSPVRLSIPLLQSCGCCLNRGMRRHPTPGRRGHWCS